MAGFCDLGSSQVDIGRLERRGFPEAVFSEGKSPEEVASIVQLLAEKNGVALATRANRMQYEKVRESLPDARFEPAGRCIVIERDPLPRLPGRVALVSAGTSDGPVLQETRVALELFGNSVEVIQDVGVAGRRFAERNCGNGEQAGDSSSYKRGIRRQLRRDCSAARNAEQLCRRRDSREYRQWFWSRIRGLSDQSRNRPKPCLVFDRRFDNSPGYIWLGVLAGLRGGLAKKYESSSLTRNGAVASLRDFEAIAA